MRILVLGASGACGEQFVRLAVGRGHEIVAVVRPGSVYQPPEPVAVIRGEVTDSGFLASVVTDHVTIVSCLGLRRASLLPWSRLLSPPDLVQRVMGSLVRYATADTRVTWISAGGVGDSRDRATLPVRWMIDAGHVGTAYADLEGAEELVRESERDWLAVRPVTLIPGGPTGRAAPVPRYRITSVVRRGDVAQWMLDVTDRTIHYEGRAVLLGTTSR